MAAARPDVLGYPSPTTSRYLLFAVALLCSGLFVGNWVHTQTQGDEWLDVVRDCQARFPTGLGDPAGFDPAAAEVYRDNVECTAHVERVRSGFSAGGAGVVLVAALVILYLAPYLVRRRRELRPLGPRLEGAETRFEELAAEAGVGHRVRPLLGTSRQRDAFSFGAPGRLYVALPPALAVRWRQAQLFDPLMRHELAHIRHRDVALAWLTRSVWFAFVPLLALPILVGAFGDDRSLLAGYVPRALVLAGVVALLSAALLRSREYVADLRAARLGGDWQSVAALTGGGAAAGSRIRPLSRHPNPRTRVAVLESPLRLTRTGLVDGLVAGFLAALSVPLVVAAVNPVLTSFGQTQWANLMAACLLGPVLGGSVGLGIWRAALFDRLGGTPAVYWTTAVGVAMGVLLGEAASLQQSGLGSLAGLDSPGWLAVTALAAGGATLLSNGLACLWADQVPRLGLRASWLLSLLVNTVLFSAVLYASRDFLIPAEAGGWPAVRIWLTLALGSTGMAVMTLTLLVVAMLPLVLRAWSGPAPGWLLERGDAPWPPAAPIGVRLPLLVAVSASAAAVSAIVVFRQYVGAASDPDELTARVWTYYWVAGAASAATVVALGLLRGMRGVGAGLAAGPVAAVAVTAGFFVYNEALGGITAWVNVEPFLKSGVLIGFAFALITVPVVVAVLALLRGRPASLSVHGAWVGALAAVLALSAAAPGIAVRHHLVGSTPYTNPEADLGLASGVDVRAEVNAYADGLVQPMISRLGILEQLAFQLDRDPALDDLGRAVRIETEVVAPLRALLDEVASYEVVSADLREVHDRAITVLEAAVSAWDTLAEGYRTGNQELFARANEHHAEALDNQQEWLAALAALQEDVGLASD